MGFPFRSGGGEVDDREVRVRELGRDGGRGFSHEEAVRHDHVELLLGELAQVGHVVGVRVGEQHARVDAELALGALSAVVGRLVEAAVVETADVRDHAGLDGVGLLAAASTAAVAAFVVVAAAGGDAERQRGAKSNQEKPEFPTHCVNLLGVGGWSLASLHPLY